MSIHRLAVVDDHFFFRKGLVAFLGTLKYLKVVAEASDGLEFLELLKQKNPEIVLMDIRMPRMDGIEATRQALIEMPKLKVIAISMLGDPEYLNSMIEAGAAGFLLKTAENDELEKAIQVVAKGGNYFSRELVNELTREDSQPENKKQPIKNENVILSSREKQVLEMICQGLTNSEIAEKIFLSPRTVDGHRANLLLKTGTKNSVSLVIFSIRNHLIELL
jgi:DNA-binding NarL/FixJ family response regulator